MGKRARIERFKPGGGSEFLRGLVARDLSEGIGNFTGSPTTTPDKAELFAFYGGQSQFLKVAHQLTAVGIFPDKGTGVLPSSPATAGGTTLKLASGVFQTQNSNLDVIGLAVLITSGAGIGECRRITGWTSGTQTVTVERAWVSGQVPAAADTYEIVYDVSWLNDVVLKAECSISGATLGVRVVLWDWPLTEAEPATFRQPIASVDDERTLASFTSSVARRDSGYFHTAPVTLDARGLLGAQIEVSTAPGGGTGYSLWMAAR